MDYYAGIDVSLEQSSVCVVGSSGKIVRETKVASEPEALSRYFAELGLPIIRSGLEAEPLSQWLREGLVDAGFDVVLLETRHVKAALSAMTVKTDRKDARGIAQLLRMGWFRPVHAKSADAQATRALLVGRKLLQGEDIGTVTADGAHDTRRCHTAIIEREAIAIIPIPKHGRPWKEGCPAAIARNETRRATRHYGRAF